MKGLFPNFLSLSLSGNKVVSILSAVFPHMVLHHSMRRLNTEIGRDILIFNLHISFTI